MTTGERPDRNLEEAMDWLMRVRDAPADGILRNNLESWLAADPDHVRAWSQARKAWQLIGEVPPAMAAEWNTAAAAGQAPAAFSARRGVPGPARGVVRHRLRRRRVRFGVVAAALAACLVLAFVPPLAVWFQADYATATAELRRVTLEDGSVVHLAPRSAIRAHFTDDRRTVTLMAGEAYFEVVPSPDRPFVVDADGLDAAVLGTAFDVRISPRTLSVGVQSGAVGVGYDRASPPVEAKLGPGDRIVIDRESGSVTRDRLAPAEVAAWRDGKLFVADATVAEVVEELRRYQSGWIVIADDRLAAERVTGLYDLRDPDRALRALVQPAGGRVRQATPLLRILSLP